MGKATLYTTDASIYSLFGPSDDLSCPGLDVQHPECDCSNNILHNTATMHRFTWLSAGEDAYQANSGRSKVSTARSSWQRSTSAVRWSSHVSTRQGLLWWSHFEVESFRGDHRYNIPCKGSSTR